MSEEGGEEEGGGKEGEGERAAGMQRKQEPHLGSGENKGMCGCMDSIQDVCGNSHG